MLCRDKKQRGYVSGSVGEYGQRIRNAKSDGRCGLLGDVEMKDLHAGIAVNFLDTGVDE